MWGVFVKRFNFDMFEFEFENDHRREILMMDMKPIPILNCVRYLVNKSEICWTIKDGEKLAWSEKLHKIYYPSLPFHAKFDYPLNGNIDLKKWLQFDMVFHLQNLVPNRQIKDFKEIVKCGDFKKLVYEFGGVSPYVLMRFIKDEDLIMDAFVIELFTEAFMRSRKIWMNASDVAFSFRYVDGSYRNQFAVSGARLLKNNVLVRKNEVIAFKWVLDLLPSDPNPIVDTGKFQDVEILERKLPVLYTSETPWLSVSTRSLNLKTATDVCAEIKRNKRADDIYLIVSDEGNYTIQDKHINIVRIPEVGDILTSIDPLILKNGNFGILTTNGATQSIFRNKFGIVKKGNHFFYDVVQKINGLTFLEAFKFTEGFASVDKVIFLVSRRTPERYNCSIADVPQDNILVYYVK